MNVRITARDARVKVLSATGAEALEAAIQAWLDARTTETLLGLEYKVASADYHSVVVFYTE